MKRGNRSYRRILSVLAGLLIFVLGGCINNDLPYPYIKMNILDFKVEGQSGSTYIDTENRLITFNLLDTTNIKKVKVSSIKCTDNAEKDINEGDIIDLSKDYQINLSLYQDYQWTIRASQQFDYKFVVEGQIGEAIIDDNLKMAIAMVGMNQDLRYIKIKELQLGPSNSTIVPVFPEIVDFTSKKTAVVMYHDQKPAWSLYVFQTDVEIITEKPDVWVNVAWLKGAAKENEVHGFEYREASEEEWKVLDTDKINSVGSTFTARLSGLKENTEYVYRAVSDGSYGAEVSFTTEKAIPLPGGSFDNWHKKGRIWNPWAEDENQFWDTGNIGAATMGDGNTEPTDEVWPGKNEGHAAKLMTRFIGYGSFGKLAAGNIFVGEYVDTDGTNGVLDFGRPYSSYPTRLKGYYKYISEPIDYVSTDVEDLSDLKGKQDMCRIYIALGDWDDPVRIRTKASEFKVLQLDDPNIIAYGEFTQGFTTTEYQELNIELEYRATNRKPKYLLIVCTASKYGDYFTGGTGSTLWVDEFSLEFDY